MRHRFDVVVSAHFRVGDVTAILSLADGSQQRIVLRDGRYAGDLPAAPLHLRLTHEPAPRGEAPLQIPTQDAPTLPPAGVPVEAEELFERGVSVDDSGVLRLGLIWGVHCHRSDSGPSLASRIGQPKVQDGVTGRFLASEHVACAERIGMDATGRAPRVVKGTVAPFNASTRLPIGGNRTATFGQIIALAGDFYAYLDDAARKNNPSMWPDSPGWVEFLAGDYRDPPLMNEREAVVSDIVATFDRELNLLKSGKAVGTISELIKDGASSEFPVKRYLALAGLNYCHFGAQPSDGSIHDEVNEALIAYRYYHYRALATAERASMFPVHSEDDRAYRDRIFQEALVVEAFGCHFLTDLFASGHIRVPRRKLGETFGILRGGLGMAHEMHDEDNKLGLWVTSRTPQSPRLVWRAYGDGMLFRPEAKPHFWVVREAVRRSVDEVFLRFMDASNDPQAASAESLLPVALAAGTAPQLGDILPGPGSGAPAQSPPNHCPLYALMGIDGESQIMRRVNKDDPHSNFYSVQDGDDNTFSLPLPRP